MTKCQAGVATEDISPIKGSVKFVVGRQLIVACVLDVTKAQELEPVINSTYTNNILQSFFFKLSLSFKNNENFFI